MGKKRQKRQTSSNEREAAVTSVDRISSLPDSIICDILSFLPETRYAVRTSILSRRSRFLWRGVYNLCFYDDCVCGESEERLKEKSRKFELLIDNVLLLSTVQSMHKFSFSCRSGLIEQCCFNTWISTAIARNVRELDIRNYVSVLDLPSCLFTCGTLDVLALWGLLEVDVPNLVCLPRLTQLTLAGVQVNECLSKLVSGCPILESLHFEGNYYNLMTIFTISSPSLKRLHLDAVYEFPEDHSNCKVEIDTPALEYLYVSIDMYHGFDVAIQSMSSLAEAYIEFNDLTHFGDPSKFSDPVTQLFPALNCVKFLTLSGATMEALGIATARWSATVFERLTKLVVETDMDNWTCLLVLLKGAINLKVLHFTKESYGPYAENQESCRTNPEEIPRCLRTSLEQFIFGKLEGVEDELTVIGYVLKHGGVLKRMELCSAVSDVNTKFQLTQKILLFPRRSPTCQIAFH